LVKGNASCRSKCCKGFNFIVGPSLHARSAPEHCVLLRWGGQLSLLDLVKGSELLLAVDVEAFWLSAARPATQTGATRTAVAPSTGLLGVAGIMHRPE
jgi:hypothetical protein